MLFDDDDFEFAAIEVTPDMEAGLMQAFRDAASGGGEHDGCPICAYLASTGQTVPHDHGAGEKPLFAWVSPELKSAVSRRAKPKAVPPTRAQRRRFRKRRR